MVVQTKEEVETGILLIHYHSRQHTTDPPQVPPLSLSKEGLKADVDLGWGGAWQKGPQSLTVTGVGPMGEVR